jgi:starch synthase
MRINIAASHRFHLLDLARELENLGHEVRFYSYIPTKRAVSFGLSQKSSFSLYYFMIPFLALFKLSKGAEWSVKIIDNVLDYYLALFMKPCDIYIALGTVYKVSISTAKRRYNAITILEWGSKHIDEQQGILNAIPGVKKQGDYFNDRSKSGYDRADYIAIASDHVKQSFIMHGFSSGNLLQNPYGVDLSMFKPTFLMEDNVFDVIMVGGWSYRKGCDLLIDFFKDSKLTFIHVGPIIDLPFPSNSNMLHVDSVDQRELIRYYSQAKIFVLASREEGLAMVQSQALVCGLPIVCTKDTGGRDLKAFLKNQDWIIEMEEFSKSELDRCISKALDLAKTQRGERSYAKGIEDMLSWKAYGMRYNNNLIGLKSKN